MITGKMDMYTFEGNEKGEVDDGTQTTYTQTAHILPFSLSLKDQDDVSGDFLRSRYCSYI
jgi:hypothetical protein